MKFLSPRAGVLLLAAISPSLVHGQATDDKTAQTRILGTLADGKEAPPTVRKPAKLRTANSRILSTTRTRQNGRTVTIHRVEPPEPLPVPPKKKPAPELAPEDIPALQNTPAVMPMRTVGISSTVYGRGTEKLTRLTLHHRNQNYYAWSNIDFRHLHGFAAYKANGRDYFFLLGAGLARDTRGKVLGLNDAYRDGCPRNFPPAGGRAAFVLTGGSEKNSDPNPALAREILDDMHTLYRKEKNRLAAAHRSRLAMAPINARRARERREAPPKDITIRFWKRDMEAERARIRQHAVQEGESR